MSCAKCNSELRMTGSSGGTTDGTFMEEYECARGHKGYISGEASNSPDSWNKTGTAFA